MNINEILRKINIVKVVEQYLALEKKGQNYLALCPFHADTKPSLSVSESKQIYKCFVCNHSGNAIKFVMDYKKLSFIGALEEIKKNLNLDFELDNQKESYEIFRIYELNALVNSWYHNFLLNKENESIYQYLINRKISKELIEKFQLGFAPNKKDLIYQLAINKNNIRHIDDEKSRDVFSLLELTKANLITVLNDGSIIDFFNDRIMVPIFDQNNNLIAFSGRVSINNNSETKYLNSPTTIAFKKSEILYNTNNLDKECDTAYLVEGFFDVFSLDAIGIKNPLATMGTSFGNDQIKLLKSKNIKNIVLCLDNDNAGQTAEYEIAKLLTANNINIFSLNEHSFEYKDFNEFLINDEHNFKKVVNNIDDYCLNFIKKEIKNINSLNPIELNNKFLELIKKINETGNVLYLNKYVSLMSQSFRILEDEIKNKIHFAKKITNEFNNKPTYNKQQYTRPIYNNYNKNINPNVNKQKVSINYKDLYKLKLDYINLLNNFIRACFYSRELFDYFMANYNIQQFNGLNNEINNQVELKEVSSTYSTILNYLIDFYSANTHLNAILNQYDDNYSSFLDMVNQEQKNALKQILDKDVYAWVKKQGTVYSKSGLERNILQAKILEIEMQIEVSKLELKTFDIFDIDEQEILKIKQYQRNLETAKQNLKTFDQIKGFKNE